MSGRLDLFDVRDSATLLTVLRNDKRMIFQAAAHAQRAADFLLKLPEQKEEAAAEAASISNLAHSSRHGARSQRQGKLLRYDVKNEFCLQGTCLLPARCPPYIARLVREGVIPAAERICGRWPRPKIAQKRLEASPPC
jgi:hypothetical protein